MGSHSIATSSLPITPHVPLSWKIKFILSWNLVALAGGILTGHWDSVEHAKGVVDTFWYPPHYGIYFSIVSAGILSLIALIFLLSQTGYFFEKIRRNMALVVVTLFNFAGFAAAPLDVWWHQTYGFDTTIWTPPHFILWIGGVVMTSLGLSVYFLDSKPNLTPLRLVRLKEILHKNYYPLVLSYMMAILMATFILFSEYENSANMTLLQARPPWTYPVLWPSFVVLMFALVMSATRYIGMATIVAALCDLPRLLVIPFDRAFLNYRGMTFYPLVIPAIALDLSCFFIWWRWGKQMPLKAKIATGLVVSSVVTITTPLYWMLLNVFPQANVYPWLTYWPLSLVVGVPASLGGWYAGSLLRRLRPQQSSVLV